MLHFSFNLLSNYVIVEQLLSRLRYCQAVTVKTTLLSSSYCQDYVIVMTKMQVSTLLQNAKITSFMRPSFELLCFLTEVPSEYSINYSCWISF